MNQTSPNYIHSLDAKQLNQMPKALQLVNEEHGPKITLHPLQQQMVNSLYKHFCKECGKKDGHYIGCKEGTD